MKNRVFLVDDDKNILTSLTMLLESEGFKVNTFSDGESGLNGILNENPDKKTWITVVITFLAVIYIFYDSIKLGNFFGDLFGFITALGLAIGAIIIRSAKNRNLVPAALIGKLLVGLFALYFVESFKLLDKDIFIVPLMCVLCVAIPFVFWGMGDVFRGGNQKTIVKIDKEKISIKEFTDYINNYSSSE